MLYKYLFYSFSYFIKKYDKLWDVGNTYYVFGAGHIGLMIYASIMNVLFIIEILFFNENITFFNEHVIENTKYLSSITFLSSIFYFKYKNRHIKIYEEMKKIKGNKKKIYKLLNIIHIVFVYMSLFILLGIIKKIH